ncbi:GTP-binding protein Rhes [Aplochiton taeniatus]
METKVNITTCTTDRSTIPVAHQVGCANLDGPRSVQCPSDSSKGLLAYENAAKKSNYPDSIGIKTGIGISKTATCQWRHQERRAWGARSSSNVADSQQPSCSSNSSKTSALNQLASLAIQGQTRLHQRDREQLEQDPQCATKPQNCKRIVVLGAPRVGKTSILRRYLRDGFAEDYKPTAEDFVRKLFRIRGETYQIDILDASGERSFPAKRRLSILTGDIFLLVFSVDDRCSFEEVCALCAEIADAKTKLLKSPASGHGLRVPTVICANKVDLPPAERVIYRAEVLQALGKDCVYFETSAKDSTNLEEVFETIANRGGLPKETGPSRHRKVSLRSYQTMHTGRMAKRGSQTANIDDPCGALYPLARRPSFSADLRQVIGPKSSRKPVKQFEKCQIQ